MRTAIRYIAGVGGGAVTAALLHGTIASLGAHRPFTSVAINAGVLGAVLCVWIVPLALIARHTVLRARRSNSRLVIGLTAAPIAYFVLLLMWRVLALIGDDIDMAGSTLWSDIRFAVLRFPLPTIAWMATFAVAAGVMGPVLPLPPRLR